MVSDDEHDSDAIEVSVIDEMVLVELPGAAFALDEGAAEDLADRLLRAVTSIAARRLTTEAVRAMRGLETPS